MSIARRMSIVPEADREALLRTALKVAFATRDMQHVNEHFGSAQTFVFYAVDPEQAQMLEAVEFGQLKQDGNEDKLASKLDLLEGCAAVYCQAAGASAIKQLMARGIQPVKVQEQSLITELVKDLQAELLNGPSSWVAKALAKQSGPDMSRFDAMEAEGWEE